MAMEGNFCDNLVTNPRGVPGAGDGAIHVSAASLIEQPTPRLRACPSSILPRRCRTYTSTMLVNAWKISDIHRVAFRPQPAGDEIRDLAFIFNHQEAHRTPFTDDREKDNGCRRTGNPARWWGRSSQTHSVPARPRGPPPGWPGRPICAVRRVHRQIRRN
jgi:hypothetical protein